MTGSEYILLLTKAKHQNVTNLKDKNIFNLPLNKYISTYSTGMKKKLAFTGVLLQKSDYYIFDEPFNGVDIHSNILISEIIKVLRKKRKTIIITSHIFSTLSEVCDTMHLLKAGEIIKSVDKSDFIMLEKNMKTFTIDDIIYKLDL